MVSGVLGGTGHEGTGAGDLQAEGSHGTPQEAAPGPLRDDPSGGLVRGAARCPGIILFTKQVYFVGGCIRRIQRR